MNKNSNNMKHKYTVITAKAISDIRDIPTLGLYTKLLTGDLDNKQFLSIPLITGISHTALNKASKILIDLGYMTVHGDSFEVHDVPDALHNHSSVPDLFGESPKPTKFNFKSSLLEYGFESDVVDDWLLVRKKLRATNTKTAYLGFIKEVEKSPLDKNIILQECVVRSWKGFKAEWLNDLNSKNNARQDRTEQNNTDSENRRERLAKDLHDEIHIDSQQGD